MLNRRQGSLKNKKQSREKLTKSSMLVEKADLVLEEQLNESFSLNETA